jgi:hypothetical protein
MALGKVNDKLLADMEKWIYDGYIDCPNCERRIETDVHCSCGWRNPMLDLGMI